MGLMKLDLDWCFARLDNAWTMCRDEDGTAEVQLACCEIRDQWMKANTNERKRICERLSQIMKYHERWFIGASVVRESWEEKRRGISTDDIWFRWFVPMRMMVLMFDNGVTWRCDQQEIKLFNDVTAKWDGSFKLSKSRVPKQQTRAVPPTSSLGRVSRCWSL